MRAHPRHLLLIIIGSTGCVASNAASNDAKGENGEIIALEQRVQFHKSIVQVCRKVENISRDSLAIGKIDSKTNLNGTLSTTIRSNNDALLIEEHRQPIPVFSSEDGRYSKNNITILNPGNSVENCIIINIHDLPDTFRIVSTVDKQFPSSPINVLEDNATHRTIRSMVRIVSNCARANSSWECSKEH